MDRDAAEPNAVLEELMERARVNRPQRDEFRAHPARSIALLQTALRRTSVHAPAAYALSRLRAELAEEHTRRQTAIAAELQAELEPELELELEDVERIRSTFTLPAVAHEVLEELVVRRRLEDAA